MGTLAISICAPPRGELATSSNGSSPTAAQIDEELQVRQRFIEAVSPYLTSLLVTVDVGDPGIAQQLSALLPKGSLLSVAGSADAAAAEPAGATAAATATNLRAKLGSVRTWALSTAERAFFTFAASFGSAVTLGGAFNISTLDATLFAAASAALAVVTAAIRSLSPPTDNATLDVVTRAGLTLLQAFAAAFVVTTAGATHFSDWRAGALAGLAAAFTALKGTLATQLNGANATNGQRATPGSLIPLHLDEARKTSVPPGRLQVNARQ